MEDLKYDDKMADAVFDNENGAKETAGDSALYFADGASCSGSTDEDSAYDSAAMSVDNDCDETESNKSVGSGKSNVGSEVKTYPDDCPVVSANNAVAYYDVLTPGPRGRSPKKPRVTCPSYYQVDMSETHYQSQYDQMNSSYPGELLTAKMEGLTIGASIPTSGNNNTAVVAANDDGLAIGAQRLAVLSYEQVRRLSDVMDDVVSIHGRGNFPTLDVRLRDLVTAVRAKLELPATEGGAGMKVRDIRLNGGAASHVLATESQPYNDLDLIFAVEFSSGRHYDRVKSAVLASLCDLLPEGAARKRVSTCGIKEAYVSKMVKVNNDGDRWSLISLGNSRGHKNVELKFVDTMRRQFEFSVDSFQIVLDSLFLFSDCAELPISENFYPTVVGESVYGDFREALYHLHKKLICTRHPEEIRGGGLLKYCNLLVKSYRAARPDRIKTLERYMCSRFFIDFPDITQQRAKLGSYLWNHFAGPEEETLKYHFLMLLHSVVEESTVCLMGHERRQTLALIENLACEELCHERQRLLAAAPQPALLYANGYYYAPIMPACYPCSCPAPWMACST